MSVLKCRACLTTDAAEYVDMETGLGSGEVTFVQFFQQCTLLQINLDDNFPRTLCNLCSNDLEAAYMFVQTAIRSNDTLNLEFAAGLKKEEPEADNEFLIDCVVLNADDALLLQKTASSENEQLENNKLVKKQKSKKLKTEKKYLCSYCPSQLKNVKSLWNHERTHRGTVADVVYMCNDCDRQYASQFLLDQHRKQAHKEKEHVCNICGNAFKLKNQLVNHMKLHLEKNLQCPHCEKRYARNFDLNVHLRSHTGELPYVCNICERRFAIKVRLTYHMQKHLGIKHRCRECGAEFNSKQKLKGHSFKHTGMPYRCTICNNRGFVNRDVFKRHLLRVHNTTMTDAELVDMFRRNTGKTTKIFEVQNVDDLVELNLIE